MAHVHRQLYSRQTPKHAQLVTVKGNGELWRWKGRGGEWMYGKPIAGKPGRCMCESAKWYVTYHDHAAGRERTVPGYTDRAATDALMVKLVQTSARVDSGLLPPEAQRERLTMAELLDRWREYTRHNSSDGGARRRHQRANAVCEGVGATRPADLTPSKVLKWVAAKVKSESLAGETAVCYLSAVKGFTRWLVLTERAEAVDHLSGLKASFDGDVHRQRRVLPPGELESLLDATAATRQVVAGLKPLERHALYLTASSTGLRAVELSRLDAAHLDREREQLVLHKPAKAKGRRKDDVISLEREVIDYVLSVCPKSGPLWPNRRSPTTAWWLRAAGMLRRDLEAAGISYRDSDGHVYDFHSLRSQYITDLDRAGVTLARMQKLARHKDPRMTARYHRPEREELAKDSAKLGRGKLVKKKGRKTG